MNQEVTLLTWEWLYGTAGNFGEFAPWDWMYDDQLFAVQNPDRKEEIGYCCVMGTLGEVMGLAVYRGFRGLDIYKKIIAEKTNPPKDNLLHFMDCLLAEFVPQKEFEEGDRAVMKKLGIKINPKFLYPKFRSFLPGSYPWYVNEAEAQFLAHCLGCATHMAQLVKQDPQLLPSKRVGEYLTYVPVEIDPQKGIKWGVRWERTPNCSTEKRPQTIQVDDLQIHRIKKLNLTPSSEWEADYFYSPMPIQSNSKERPVLPYMIMISESQSQFIILAQVIEKGCAPIEGIANGILASIIKHNHLPETLWVRNQVAYNCLKEFGKQLGIKIGIKKSLKAVNLARRELIRSIGKDFPEVQP